MCHVLTLYQLIHAVFQVIEGWFSGSGFDPDSGSGSAFDVESGIVAGSAFELDSEMDLALEV